MVITEHPIPHTITQHEIHYAYPALPKDTSSKEAIHVIHNIASQPFCLGILLSGALLGTLATTVYVRRKK